ncbi:MAG: YdeI/OmpD-associated family protein [Chitinophagaceae bacterium]|nr:YdeI/OmpD-associated family protein [Chitinophagaceae bacterium]
MKSYKDEQTIGQLEKRKGGYFYLQVNAAVVDGFANKRRTRFLCTLDKKLTFQCGLNSLGDGNFFIIISTKNLLAIKKSLGAKVQFRLEEDPNPLGVEIPPVLEALLEQDEAIKEKFEKLTAGKKRNVIHTITKIKDVDKQVQRAITIIGGYFTGAKSRPS